MVERLRLFKGAQELNFSEATIISSNDHLVDTANFSIEANSNVTNNSVIDFKKANGSTIVFSARVQEKKENIMWQVKALSNGYELHNVTVQQVYENKSPEFIVQDIIDNFTQNLTYASTETSGVTLTKYVADGYAIDIIKDMVDALQWQLRIDENDNVYFEPYGEINKGLTFTNGINASITSWQEDKTELINHIKVVGGLIEHFTKETFTASASQTDFTIDHKPAGVVKVSKDGVEQIPTTQSSIYTVDQENKKIIFSTPLSGGESIVVDYSFHIPVVIDQQDDDSINTYGEVFKEVKAPYITTFADARRFAYNFLSVYSKPLLKCKIREIDLNFTSVPGETIHVIDSIRNKDEVLVITSKTLDAANSVTIYEAGTRDLMFFDWQREVQDRIKKLERQIQEENDVAFSRIFKHNMNASLTVATTWEYNSPVDSFLIGHQTLGRFRTDLNFEADCTTRRNDGTWSGSGIGGSQYATDGFRLSCGQFNGIDNIITVPDDSDLDLNADFTICIAVRVASLPGAVEYLVQKWDGTDGWAVRIAADNKVELIYSNGGSDSTLKAATALTATVWQHITFVKQGTNLTCYIQGVSDNTGSGDAAAGTNTEDVIVGKYSSTYFTGDLDEIRVYSNDITAGQALNIFNKIQENSFLRMYLSMDNPRLGDRSTARTPVV